MTDPDIAQWIAIVISGVAAATTAVFSSISNGRAKEANTHAAEANEHAKRALDDASAVRSATARAQLELMLSESILSTRDRLLEVGQALARKSAESIADTTDADDAELAFLKVRASACEEAYCNAIEVACSLFLDDKLDKDRFKKSYHHTITEHVESDQFSKYYIEPKTRFHATLKVVRTWDPARED